ncbi:hypothetical protein [Pontibacter cellulosilyticus]|uniref:Uncharacterized protein n=1 Tax=Pontibacter cellulosilyticus TaxID=1720253 RepID=A0A923N3S6_9BACT|nr:hypothetical protein [Pontibacter cellulosilyticus]MBC5991639.1 hypothetical protein [Pontibacter cellulosilyticus]
MDDFKIILYILAAVAYFLFMQWRKAFNTPGDEQDEVEPRPQQQRRVQPQQPQRPVTSFEDILRELQPKAEKGRAELETVKEKAKEVMAPVVRDEDVVPKYKSYEQPAPKVLSWEKAAEALEAKKRSKQRRQPLFEAYAQDKEVTKSRYAAMLQNPATVRDAVILSEIFNRKYS